MGEPSDYELAFLNHLIYDKQEPCGPVSDFSIYEETGEKESGLSTVLFTREGQVRAPPACTAPLLHTMTVTDMFTCFFASQ